MITHGAENIVNSNDEYVFIRRHPDHKTDEDSSAS